MKQKQHCNELTVLSGIAILFVLGIHGCASALSRFETNPISYLWVRTLSNFVSPAVPIFLFVSGYKYALNDLDTPILIFLRKRLPPVMMSFAIINTLFWLLDSIKYMESFDPFLLLKTYIHSWVGYSVAYQLWYVPMYCFVVALCPLAHRMIPSSAMRFCIFAFIGIAQRVLEGRFPILATYPIRFISYPVFFEMGVLALEHGWRNKITQSTGALLGGAYTVAIILFSLSMPAISADALTKYIIYYFVGTAVFYSVSVTLQNNRFLHWIGIISYPLFLLHEPLIGRSIGSILGRFNCVSAIYYAVFWIILDLLVTIFFVKVIQKTHFDQILWNFKF